MTWKQILIFIAIALIFAILVEPAPPPELPKYETYHTVP